MNTIAGVGLVFDLEEIFDAVERLHGVPDAMADRDIEVDEFEALRESTRGSGDLVRAGSAYLWDGLEFDTLARAVAYSKFPALRPRYRVEGNEAALSPLQDALAYERIFGVPAVAAWDGAVPAAEGVLSEVLLFTTSRKLIWINRRLGTMDEEEDTFDIQAPLCRVAESLPGLSALAERLAGLGLPRRAPVVYLSRNWDIGTGP